MNITYRKATAQDIPAVEKMRIKQLLSEGAEASTDLMPALEDYYTRHFADGTIVVMLAECEGELVGASAVSFVEKPPYFENPTGKLGLISGVFVEESFRRQGIAKTLLGKIIGEAERYGCKHLQVTSSKMGVPLYKSVGFSTYDRYLQLTVE